MFGRIERQFRKDTGRSIVALEMQVLESPPEPVIENLGRSNVFHRSVSRFHDRGLNETGRVTRIKRPASLGNIEALLNEHIEKVRPP